MLVGKSNATYELNFRMIYGRFVFVYAQLPVFGCANADGAECRASRYRPYFRFWCARLRWLQFESRNRPKDAWAVAVIVRARRALFS